MGYSLSVTHTYGKAITFRYITYINYYTNMFGVGGLIEFILSMRFLDWDWDLEWFRMHWFVFGCGLCMGALYNYTVLNCTRCHPRYFKVRLVTYVVLVNQHAIETIRCEAIKKFQRTLYQVWVKCLQIKPLTTFRQHGTYQGPHPATHKRSATSLIWVVLHLTALRLPLLLFCLRGR